MIFGLISFLMAEQGFPPPPNVCGLLILLTFSHKEDVLQQKAAGWEHKDLFLFFFLQTAAYQPSCVRVPPVYSKFFNIEKMLVYMLLMNVITVLEEIHLASVYDF